MTVSAYDVAAAIRDRLTEVNPGRLHALLYYVQGHHVAHTGQALFSETVEAWDLGPVVRALWGRESDETGPGVGLDNTALNSVGYVCSRYGRLTAIDLRHLTRAEPPWRFATAAGQRRPGESAPIRLEWLREYFGGEGAAGFGDEWPVASGTVRAFVASSATAIRTLPPQPDDPEKLRARVNELRAKSS